MSKCELPNASDPQPRLKGSENCGEILLGTALGVSAFSCSSYEKPPKKTLARCDHVATEVGARPTCHPCAYPRATIFYRHCFRKPFYPQGHYLSTK